MTTILKRITWIFILLCACLIIGHPAKAVAGTLVTSDFIDKVEINGDLRIRYEYKEKDVSHEDPVDRLRQRFRLGMKWNNPEENWKLAAGLTTGPVDATSTDQTYSETKFFDKGNISLDYAYAEHKLGGFKLLAGQQKNPFETSWLLWDTDVRPAGFTGQYSINDFFATAGWYDVRYINNDIAQMDAIQTGVKMEMVTASLAFYNFHRTDEILNDYISLNIAPDIVKKINKNLNPEYKSNLDPDYKYQIIDFYTAGNIKADPVEIKPYAQVFYNIGAEGKKGQSALSGTLKTNDPETGEPVSKPVNGNIDPEDENLGWIIGVEGKIDRFSARLDYAQIGADSCVQGLKDATFGSELNSTDIKGFRVGVGYKVTKNCWLDANGFFYEPKKRDLDQDAKTYQIDLNYKF